MTTVKQRLSSIRTRIERELRQRLRQSENPGRNLDVYPDDTYIVSYPKSGNTWVRFLVATLLHPDGRTDFGNIDSRVPTIYKAPTSTLDQLPRPRVLKSHEYFDPRYPRVIYIVRDPRDVLLSYFHYQRRKGVLGDQDGLETFAENFLSGRVSEYGTWQENVSSWLAARGERSSFLLVRYEDLLGDGIAQLAKISQFLGRSTDATTLARIVDECSFENMRRLETETGRQSKHMKSARTDIAFVRQGKSGTWASEMPAAIGARLASEWKPLLDRLGYR